MSDKSPLFVSSLELLAHATELYAKGQTTKYKFVILHVANAVELILKDHLIDEGISIYKNPKETISIWGAFDALDKLGTKVPEKPVIELLIDDRNTIQHRFGFPNAETVFFYLEQVVAFFVRFLDEHYGVKLSEALSPYLSAEDLSLIGLVTDDYSHLKRLYKISPDAAVLQSYAMIEGKIREKSLDENFKRPANIAAFLRDGLDDVAFKENMDDFVQLKDARNRAAHMASSENTDVDWEKALHTALRILKLIDSTDTE